MSKKFLIIALVALCLSPFKPMKAQHSFIDKAEIGWRYGLNYANLHYSHEMFDIYTHKGYLRNMFGMFMTYRIGNHFAIRPEVDYVERGVVLKYKDINYKLDARYCDLRCPVIVFFAPHSAVNPYLFVAPEFCIVGGGEIFYKSNLTGKMDTELSEGNIRSYDFGVLAGAGLEVPIRIRRFRFSVAMEAGYNLGLLNTFSDDELDGDAVVLNPTPYTYTPEGSRNNRGIEASVTVSLPLSNLHLIPKPKPKPVVEPEPELEPEVVEYEIKDCYSFEEIYSFVKSGIDVSDKRICVFDMKFEFGSAKLKHSSEKYLNNVASMMKAFPKMKIQINGHTDNVGSEEFNQTLSEQRAQSVFDYLVKQGIEADRMSCRGFGFRFPIDTNDTDAGRARNRRVEIEVTKIE